jgi:hypothetical protein
MVLFLSVFQIRIDTIPLWDIVAVALEELEERRAFGLRVPICGEQLAAVLGLLSGAAGLEVVEVEKQRFHAKQFVDIDTVRIPAAVIVVRLLFVGHEAAVDEHAAASHRCEHVERSSQTTHQIDAPSCGPEGLLELVPGRLVDPRRQRPGRRIDLGQGH